MYKFIFTHSIAFEQEMGGLSNFHFLSLQVDMAKES